MIFGSILFLKEYGGFCHKDAEVLLFILIFFPLLQLYWLKLKKLVRKNTKKMMFFLQLLLEIDGLLFRIWNLSFQTQIFMKICINLLNFPVEKFVQLNSWTK